MDINGIRIPISLVKKLLFIADEYWIIDICPNLKCKFAKPNIIFSSLSILIKGKWYIPASGLLIVSSVITKKQKKIVISRISNSFLLKFFFLKKKIKEIIKIIKVLIMILKGAKKLTNKAKNEEYIKPIIATSEKSFKLLIFIFANNLPKVK